MKNGFNWTEDDLAAQYETAKVKGWLPLFRSAAAASGFETGQLLGLASRESGPFWTGTSNGIIMGDHGHAWGLFQVNDNFHPSPSTYKAPEQNIQKGASILASYRAQILKKVADYPDPVGQATVDLMVFASYNRGVGGMWRGWTEHGDPDWPTANQNYAKDCQARSEVFKKLIDAEEAGSGSNG